jgi:predicted RNA binding protein YcfA (HicA-like mRNA interferase family)
MRRFTQVTRLEKLIEALRRRPPNADFADVRKVLEAYGWEQTRQKGSHVTFAKKGVGIISIPLHEGDKVKRIYIDQVLKLVGLDE